MKRSASEPGLNNQLRQASHCLGQAKGNSFMSKEHARIRAFFLTLHFLGTVQGRYSIFNNNLPGM